MSHWLQTLRGIRAQLYARADAWSDMLSSTRELYTSGGISAAQRDIIVSRSGLAHRLMWCVPSDALAEGWATDTDDAQDVTADWDAAMRLEPALRAARASARIHGGAWLWLASDAPDYAEPMRQGEAVRAVHPVARHEYRPDQYETRPTSLDFMRPVSGILMLRRDGWTYPAQRVHASRLVYVPGSPRSVGSQQQGDGDGWGYDISTLELYRQALADLDGTGSSVARLLDRISMFHLKLKSGRATMSGDEGAALQEQLDILATSMRAGGIIPLFGDDDAAWAGPSLAGTREAVMTLNERVSCIEGIPLSRVFGQAPGGLSTDDASGRRTYDALLASERRNVLAPAILQVYERALGPDPSRRIRWPQLSPPTATEQAAISAQYASRDATLVQAGIVAPDEARRRLLWGEEAPVIPGLDELPPLPGLDERVPTTETGEHEG